MTDHWADRIQHCSFYFWQLLAALFVPTMNDRELIRLPAHFQLLYYFISFKPRLLRRGTFKVGREVTAEVIPEYIKKQGKQTRHKNSDCSERNPAPWGGVIHSAFAPRRKL
jgi:hypothetical protein